MVILAEALSESVSFAPLFFKTILVTIFILVLAVLAIRYLVPRMNLLRRNKDSNIQILDYQSLDQRKAVYILKIENKKVAVGVTDHTVSKICDLE
jgi:flagellar biogenesis protein FliO